MREVEDQEYARSLNAKLTLVRKEILHHLHAYSDGDANIQMVMLRGHGVNAHEFP